MWTDQFQKQEKHNMLSVGWRNTKSWNPNLLWAHNIPVNLSHFTVPGILRE